jgi:hypothetical protein
MKGVAAGPRGGKGEMAEAEETRSVLSDVGRERLKEDPVVGDFLEMLPNLLPDDKDLAIHGGRRRLLPPRDDEILAHTFSRLAASIGPATRAGLITFTITGSGEWTLAVTPQGIQASEGAAESPDLHVICRTDVWLEIAAGQLSPLEAFGTGRLRIRGDIELARFLVSRLREPRANQEG